MSVDKETVKKDRQACLGSPITEAEADALVPELNNILGWVEQLGEVDCSKDVEPMTAVIPNKLRLRDDEVTDGDMSARRYLAKRAGGRTWLLSACRR